MKRNFCEAESPDAAFCSLRFASIRKRCRFYEAGASGADCRHVVVNGCGRSGCAHPVAVKNALRRLEK